MKKVVLLVFVLLPLLVAAQTGLRLPSILSNHAVMQASSNVKLWGWATCTIPVKIVCNWNASDTIAVMPKKDCSWEAMVKTPKAGGPYSITFTSAKEQTTISDLLMGEVWLCSGQSNMEFNLNWGDLDAGNVLQTCKNNSIRFFIVERGFNDYPSAD
jgi:sialate O-acetylesterase